MNKKEIAELVKGSYTANSLDAKKVEKITTLLSREDLKKYVRGLKLSEKARTLSLVLVDKKFYNKSLVKGVKKRIEIIEDPSLLLGAKIIDNDIVYDMSLKNKLDAFMQSL